MIIALAAGAAGAAEHHVSPAGDDAAEGSSARPWRTLQRAADAAQPGDTVHVRAGDYDGFNLEDRAGTAEQPIVFTAEPGVRVVRPGPMPQRLPLNTRALRWTWPKWPHGIYLWGCSHVAVEGFEIRGMPAAEPGEDGAPLHRGGAGIRVDVSDHITLRRNVADQNGRWGIFTSFVDDALIEDNEASRSGSEHGIYVSNSADRPVIRGNHAWGNRGSGIQINADNNFDDEDYRARGGVVDGIVTGAVVEGNVLHDNGAAGGAAINLDGVQDGRVAGNLLYNNHGWGVALFQENGAEGARRNRVVDNTIIMAADGRYAVQIAGCQSAEPATGACREASAPPVPEWTRPPGRATGSTGNVLANNVLLGLDPRSGSIRIDRRSLEEGAASGEELRSDHNVVTDRLAISASGDTRKDEVLSLAEWRARTGQDRHSRLSAPAAEGEGCCSAGPGAARGKAGAALIPAVTGAALLLWRRRRAQKPSL